MDLNGVWTDTNMNGLFDSHTGDVAPEIWLGRIDAHAADFGSEIQMLSQYFQKNHLYRTGSLTPPSRALAFIDDDWSNYSDCGLSSIYGASDVTVVNSESQTPAQNYLSRLAEGYEFVHLMAHSCPWGHTFKVPTGMAGTVMAPEIASNPVRSNLAIRLPEENQTFSGSLSIYDISGRKVLESNAVIECGNSFSLDCTGLPSGIYSLIIQNAEAPLRFTLLR